MTLVNQLYPSDYYWTTYSPPTTETITEETVEYDEKGQIVKKTVKTVTKTHPRAYTYPRVTYSTPMHYSGVVGNVSTAKVS